MPAPAGRKVSDRATAMDDSPALAVRRSATRPGCAAAGRIRCFFAEMVLASEVTPARCGGVTRGCNRLITIEISVSLLLAICRRYSSRRNGSGGAARPGGATLRA